MRAPNPSLVHRGRGILTGSTLVSGLILLWAAPTAPLSNLRGGDIRSAPEKVTAAPAPVIREIGFAFLTYSTPSYARTSDSVTLSINADGDDKFFDVIQKPDGRYSETLDAGGAVVNG